MLHWAPNSRPRTAVLFRLAMLLCLLPFVCQPAHALLLLHPHPQHHEDHQEIAALDATWCRAVLASDVKTLESLLDDDFLTITSRGTLESRELFLERLRNQRMKITSLECNDRHIRFFGATALVTVRVKIRGAINGSDFTGQYRDTRVYIHDEQGQWKLANLEVQRLRGSSER